MYNFSVVATSETDEYTDIKTQMTSVNESTIPADPVIVHNLASVNNGSCDISVLNDGNLFNQTWRFVYGANPNVRLTLGHNFCRKSSTIFQMTLMKMTNILKYGKLYIANRGIQEPR